GHVGGRSRGQRHDEGDRTAGKFLSLHRHGRDAAPCHENEGHEAAHEPEGLGAANHRDAHATSRWNRSGSTLPPDSTATVTLSRTSTLPVMSAASATARPGPTTSLRSRNATAPALATSSSVAASPSPTSARLISNVIRPGVGDMRASQIDPEAASFTSRRPERNDRAWSSKP